MSEDHDPACDCQPCLDQRTSMARLWMAVDEIFEDVEEELEPIGADEQIIELLQKLHQATTERDTYFSLCEVLNFRLRELASLLENVYKALDEQDQEHERLHGTDSG